MKNIIVFDIETKDAFSDVGGRSWFEKLEISVLGAYDYETDELIAFEEHELDKFADRLSRRPLLVGFNSRCFDTPILQKYIKFDLRKLPQLDIMEELTKTLGHRVALDSVARATLSVQKSGSGLKAIRLWREGQLDELKKYCLDDVRITKDIFEYGAAHGELFYVPKFGPGRARVPVAWQIKHPDEKESDSAQQTLF
ncbi:MAG: ribonuclease H-like domain-containing protein [Pseudomonadota bacterium]